MKKKVRAVKPYIYPNNSNFKIAPYEAWKAIGGGAVGERPCEKYYESLSYHLPLPTIHTSRKEARLRFVEAANLMFDTFPDYLFYEIIPIVWDCWPRSVETVAKWFRKHNVKTAFFTSSQTAERVRGLCPECRIFHLPEAIDTLSYKEGGLLKDRKYDYLEFGRCCSYVDSSKLGDNINMLSSRGEKGALKNRSIFIDTLANSKIVLCVPRMDNQPELAQGIETLTQRYWECMLSRVVILGRAPKELIDIVGYDPVVRLQRERFAEQVEDITRHIDDYQALVDKNREKALEVGSWEVRMRDVMRQLEALGYEIS